MYPNVFRSFNDLIKFFRFTIFDIQKMCADNNTIFFFLIIFKWKSKTKTVFIRGPWRFFTLLISPRCKKGQELLNVTVSLPFFLRTLTDEPLRVIGRCAYDDERAFSFQYFRFVQTPGWALRRKTHSARYRLSCRREKMSVEKTQCVFSPLRSGKTLSNRYVLWVALIGGPFRIIIIIRRLEDERAWVAAFSQNGLFFGIPSEATNYYY